MKNILDIDVNEKITEIYEQAVSRGEQKSSMGRRGASKKFDFSMIGDKFTTELIKGLFDCLKTDQDGKVYCAELIEHLIMIGIGVEPTIFIKIFKKYLRVDNIVLAKITPEEFYTLLFSNKQADRIMEGLRKHTKPKKTLSQLPNLKSKPASSLTPTRFKLKAHEQSAETYISLIKSWWKELVPVGSDIIPFNSVAQWLINKEIIATFADAKKMFSSHSLISEESFLEVFCISIIKSQLLQAAKKMNKIGINKPFLTPYHKLSCVKREILISRISPQTGSAQRINAEKAVNGLINYRLLKKMLK